MILILYILYNVKISQLKKKTVCTCKQSLATHNYVYSRQKHLKVSAKQLYRMRKWFEKKNIKVNRENMPGWISRK